MDRVFFGLNTILVSLRNGLEADAITMREAQESLYKAGWFNYLPSEKQVKDLLYL